MEGMEGNSVNGWIKGNGWKRQSEWRMWAPLPHLYKCPDLPARRPPMGIRISAHPAHAPILIAYDGPL